MKDELARFKVIMLGESGVGKTSIINRFTENNFNPNQSITVCSTFSTSTIKLESGKKITFELWDTAGQEKYRSLTKLFYQDANCAVLVYDLTNRRSYEEAKTYWYEQIKSCASPNVVVVLCGNKSDKVEEEEVRVNEVKDFCRENDILFHMTSAQTKSGIVEMFTEIATKFSENEKVFLNDRAQRARSVSIVSSDSSNMKSQGGNPNEGENKDEDNDNKKDKDKEKKKCC